VREPLLTARAVAELLDVSPETVLRWTRRGELPAIRLPGGAIRYRPDDLDAWLEAHAAVGTAGDEELTTTRADRARSEAYSVVGSSSTTIPPPLTVARNEEENDAR
jgi:excisionase family DNA binding protein